MGKELKQKQIEEMVDIYIQHAISEFDKHGFSATARQMYIEKSRLTMFGICSMFFEKGYRKIPENAAVLTKEELANMRCENIEAISQAQAHTRIETAEKFAEKLKDKRFDEYSPEGKCYECVAVSDIDEICKEFTEGEYGESLCEE